MAKHNGRVVVGTLYYPTPPVPGTILGPNAFGEQIVVLGSEEGVTYLGFATTEEIKASFQRDPQSVTEARMR